VITENSIISQKLATVPCDLLLIAAPVSDCRTFSDSTSRGIAATCFRWGGSLSLLKGKKVKASHTRYRALGRSWSRCTGGKPAGDDKSSTGGRLPLLSARPAVTFPDSEHHRPLAGTKLYCLMTEAHRCEQLAQGCCAAFSRVGFESATYWSQVHSLLHVNYC